MGAYPKIYDASVLWHANVSPTNANYGGITPGPVPPCLLYEWKDRETKGTMPPPPTL